MCKLEHHQGSFSALLGVCLIIFIYFFASTPSIAQSVSPVTSNPQTSENLIVFMNDGLVSVKATEASLKNIVQKIGQGMNIEVVVQINKVGRHE